MITGGEKGSFFPFSSPCTTSQASSASSLLCLFGNRNGPVLHVALLSAKLSFALVGLHFYEHARATRHSHTEIPEMPGRSTVLATHFLLRLLSRQNRMNDLKRNNSQQARMSLVTKQKCCWTSDGVLVIKWRLCECWPGYS